MPERPEDFDTLGSETTLWAETTPVTMDHQCDLTVSYVFLNGVIFQVVECACGGLQTGKELSAERVEALQDQLYNWVAWRQS